MAETAFPIMARMNNHVSIDSKFNGTAVLKMILVAFFAF